MDESNMVKDGIEKSGVDTRAENEASSQGEDANHQLAGALPIWSYGHSKIIEDTLLANGGGHYVEHYNETEQWDNPLINYPIEHCPGQRPMSAEEADDWKWDNLLTLASLNPESDQSPCTVITRSRTEETLFKGTNDTYYQVTRVARHNERTGCHAGSPILEASVLRLSLREAMAWMMEHVPSPSCLGVVITKRNGYAAAERLDVWGGLAEEVREQIQQFFDS